MRELSKKKLKLAKPLLIKRLLKLLRQPPLSRRNREKQMRLLLKSLG